MIKKPLIFILLIIAGNVSAATFYSGAGDGQVGRVGEEVWNTIHDAVVGTPNYTNTVMWAVANGYWSYGVYYHDITRAFFPVDTSGIPDDENILSATFNFYVSSVDSSKFRLVQTTQALTGFLFTGDYDECGAVDDPTAGATDITISSTGWKVFTLNATGLGWINKTGWTKLGIREAEWDAEDDAAGGYNRIQIRSSEYAGTDYDPYLEVTYGVASERRIMTIF